VRLGVATYSAPGGFAYVAGDNARVTIEGVDTLQTVIARSTTPASAVTLQASSPMTLTNLQVEAAAASSPRAVAADAQLTTDQLFITDAPGATGTTGIAANAGGVLDNVRIDVGGNGDCIRTSGAPRVDIRHSVLESCTTGVNAAGADTHVEHTMFSFLLLGVNSSASGATTYVEDCLILIRAGGTYGVSAGQSGASATTVYLEQSTILGTGTGTGAAVFNLAGTGSAQMNMYDTIVRGFATPISEQSDMPSHPAAFVGDFNAYTGTPTGPVSSTNVYTADPQFVSPADGNYRLAADSPLLDQDAFALQIIREPAVDLADSVRIINGARDLGAYERLLAPTAETTDATDVTQTGAAVGGTVGGGGGIARVQVLYGTTDAYGSSADAPDTPADLTTHATGVPLTGLQPGTTYHYAVEVTNSTATVRSADHTFTTAAIPPPAPPDGGNTTPPPPIASALTAFSITPGRFKSARSGATFAKAVTGAKVAYTLTAAGPLTLQVLKAKRGVRVGGRCLAPKKGRGGKRCRRYTKLGVAATRQAAAGKTTLRFSGRVAAKRLKPGRYRLTATAASGAPRSVGFRIVRR
jgi:hypothetical protein